jgi:hypothetical protein
VAAGRRAVGRVFGRAAKSGGVYLPHTAPRTQKQAVGRIWPRADTVFSGFLLQITVFNCFLFSFEQISYSFFYSSYSNENLFRECKSYRNFSEKLKVDEFYSCFRCKQLKGNCLNAIK